MGLFRVLTPWSGEVTWNTAPQTAPEPVSSIAFCTDAGWVEADITALVADWLGDPQGNQGLMAKFERENREQWVQTQFWGPLCPDDAKRPRIVFECE